MKTRKNIVSALILLTALLIVISGLLKLAQVETVIKTMTALGVGEYVPYLGIMEIMFTLLFVFPQTFRLGFILLTSYFSGALATELSHAGSVINPLVPLILIWTTAFLKDKSLFISEES
ncbi:MAG TPA: hypothetical protein DIW27_04945 [Cytophagales bacterium]|nr:hypothetical protein [Cytophagales bacterium]